VRTLWKIRRAADLLGIARQTLRTKIKEYGLAGDTNDD
jgi:DNA-binding protein Fis